MDSNRFSGKKSHDNDENEYEFKHIWLRDQMRTRVPEYTAPETLNIFCGTWNVNDKVFPSQDGQDNKEPELKDWLLSPSMTSSVSIPTTQASSEDSDSAFGLDLDVSDDTSSSSSLSYSPQSEPTLTLPSASSTLSYTQASESGLTSNNNNSSTSNGKVNAIPIPIPDMYIVGFQEIVDLTPVNVVLSNQKIIERITYWKQLVDQNINISTSPQQRYVLLVEKHLVGLLLLIFVKQKYIRRIRDIRGVVIPTGVLGIMGNKGAVGVRMDIDLTSVCIICSHFHSGREEVLIRNMDYRNIVEKSTFPPSSSSSLGGSGDKKAIQVRRETMSRWYFDEWLTLDYTIFDHDIVFWLGDLNYRIDESIPTEEVFKAVQSGNWQQYISKDQLCIERLKRTVFNDFYEGEITFSPSYKYQPGTDLYEARPDKKTRAPAWCDRILYRYKQDIYPDAIKLLQYRKANLNVSDHKPIYGSFECNIRTSVPEKQRQVYQSLLTVIDRWENSTTPKIELLNRMLEFGKVSYLVEKIISIPIKNIGGVFAHWAFVPKLDENIVCQRWLKFSPMNGILAPGESSEIIAKVLISEQTARAIREGNIDTKLEDIVVFRMTNGSDYFIAVSAEVDADSIAGLNTQMDDIYDPEASLKYYNEDD